MKIWIDRIIAKSRLKLASAFFPIMWNVWLRLWVPIWCFDGTRQYWSIFIMWRMLIFHWRKHIFKRFKSIVQIKNLCALIIISKTSASIKKNALKMYVYNFDDKVQIAVFDWLISACIKFCLQTQAIEFFLPLKPKTTLCLPFCSHQPNQLDYIAKD